MTNLLVVSVSRWRRLARVGPQGSSATKIEAIQRENAPTPALAAGGVCICAQSRVARRRLAANEPIDAHSTTRDVLKAIAALEYGGSDDGVHVKCRRPTKGLLPRCQPSRMKGNLR